MLLQHAVGVDEAVPQSFSEGAPDAALACPHHPDQIDVQPLQA